MSKKPSCQFVHIVLAMSCVTWDGLFDYKLLNYLTNHFDYWMDHLTGQISTHFFWVIIKNKIVQVGLGR
jgi:hypothetical protein